MTTRTRNQLIFLTILVMTAIVTVLFTQTNFYHTSDLTSDSVLSPIHSEQGKDDECLGLDLKWAPCITPVECRDPEALNTAVLSKLYSRIPATHFALQEEMSARSISEAWQEISRLREWALDIEPECIRTEYLNWIEYYEVKLNNEWAAILSGRKDKAESDYQRYIREQEELKRRADTLKSRLPEPPLALNIRQH